MDLEKEEGFHNYINQSLCMDSNPFYYYYYSCTCCTNPFNLRVSKPSISSPKTPRLYA